MTFSIVLTSECFPTHSADEWTLICVSTQMRSEVVSTSEAFWAQCTLESCRVLLNTLGATTFGGRSLILRICKTKNIVTVGQ
jgi:hypothetical protein